MDADAALARVTSAMADAVGSADLGDRSAGFWRRVLAASFVP